MREMSSHKTCENWARHSKTNGGIWEQKPFATWPIACPNVLQLLLVLVEATPTIDGQLACENIWLWQNSTNIWLQASNYYFSMIMSVRWLYSILLHISNINESTSYNGKYLVFNVHSNHECCFNCHEFIKIKRLEQIKHRKNFVLPPFWPSVYNVTPQVWCYNVISDS